jgi:hypothetical protein
MPAPAVVFPRLEPLLPTVSKPIQYVGGELNSTVKEWDAAPDGSTVRWALMYPDAYEVGLPNQGVQILYEVLNERDWIVAERTYSVWPDMEKVMRDGDGQGQIPQFTVDGHRPVREFDLFGISFSTELGYTNLLTALDLAGIPLHARPRPTTTRSCWPAGTRRSTPSRSRTSSTRPCSATVRRSCSRSPRWCASGRARAGRRSRRAAPAAGGQRWRLRAAFYDVTYAADGTIEAVVPTGPASRSGSASTR